MNLMIKQLQQEDWKLWKEVRLEAVKLHPESFGGSYEEESVKTDAEFKNGLMKSDIWSFL